MDSGLRVESNLSSEKIGSKIRSATMNKVPYMLIVGEKEQAENKVAVRHRTEGDKGAMPLEQFVSTVQQAAAARS
jgi:threonyl-tRNA synthetase